MLLSNALFRPYFPQIREWAVRFGSTLEGAVDPCAQTLWFALAKYDILACLSHHLSLRCLLLLVIKTWQVSRSLVHFALRDDLTLNVLDPCYILDYGFLGGQGLFIESSNFIMLLVH